MSSRDKILETLRNQQVAADALPDLAQFGVQYDNVENQFLDSLQLVGGNGVGVANEPEAIEAIRSLDVFSQAKKIVCSEDSSSEVAALGTTKFAEIDDPHQLEDVDLFVGHGHFAVAENGAIWVTVESIPHRASLFINQHLVLLVQRSEVLHNMHQAYERIDPSNLGYGVFISGPSKTADIEQSLVIGAHGARSLQVYLVGSE